MDNRPSIVCQNFSFHFVCGDTYNGSIRGGNIGGWSNRHTIYNRCPIPPLRASSLPLPVASSLEVGDNVSRTHQPSKPNTVTNALRTDSSSNNYFTITLSAISEPILRVLFPSTFLNQDTLVVRAKRTLEPLSIILLGSAFVLAAGAALIHVASRRA